MTYIRTNERKFLEKEFKHSFKTQILDISFKKIENAFEFDFSSWSAVHPETPTYIIYRTYYAHTEEDLALIAMFIMD